MATASNQANPSAFKVNKHEAAYMLGCSPREMLRLLDQGLPVERRGRGKDGWVIDPRAAVEWWRQRFLAEQKPDEATHELAKQRLTQERAERARIDNELSRGELVKAAHVEELAMQLAALLASEMSGLNTRLADAANQSTAAERRAAITPIVNEVRRRFSDGCAELAESCGDMAANRGGNGAAA